MDESWTKNTRKDGAALYKAPELRDGQREAMINQNISGFLVS